MSIVPEASNCPSDTWKVNRGIPSRRDISKNCRMKFAAKKIISFIDYYKYSDQQIYNIKIHRYLPPNCTLRIANLLILKRPNVHPRHANMELRP